MKGVTMWNPMKSKALLYQYSVSGHEMAQGERAMQLIQPMKTLGGK